MGVLSLAQEFAGFAALEVVGSLGLNEPEAERVFRLVRECCAAAILGAIIRNDDSGTEKKAINHPARA